MSKFFYMVAQVTGILCGTSPIALCFAIGSGDVNLFFHYWVYYVLFTFIVCMVSMVLMQILD